MSAGIPVAVAEPGRPRVLIGVQSTGLAGIASAAVIAVATLVAVFGPLLARTDPELPNLSLAWIGPGGGHPDSN